MTFGCRPCAMILPTTFAFAASGPVRSFFSSVPTANTSPKVISPPTLPGRVSTFTVSPGATRYCLLPLRMTAYIAPPDANRKPLLYGFLPRSVNAQFKGAAIKERHGHLLHLALCFQAVRERLANRSTI